MVDEGVDLERLHVVERLRTMRALEGDPGVRVDTGRPALLGKIG